jgi:hypothetical protein
MAAPKPPLPSIDYLAKDFTSFQRLMRDRLGITAPGWNERHAADTGMVLLDILAYAADYLSYNQDAVATETYLGTARRRISARRHARLLDYFMHDGCNARGFVVLEAAASAEGVTLPLGTLLLTRAPQLLTVIQSPAVSPALSAGSQPFETMHALTLHAANNPSAGIPLVGPPLAAGATTATLANSPPLTFAVGDLLLFEEIAGATTGLPGDADPTHRQVVRLTSVAADAAGLAVAWGPGDAIAFTPGACVARGNVALVDHGQTLSTPEALAPVTAGVSYLPVLAQSPLAQQGHVVDQQGDFVVFDPSTSAAAALVFAMTDVRPAITLTQQAPTGASPAAAFTWSVQRDLLASDQFATDFVVEVDDAGAAHLRFGDDVLGKAPSPGAVFTAMYRVGNGLAGNVGGESIAHVVLAVDPGILGVRNPLPTTGGVDPETVAQVQMNAPQAFQVQQRAVTLADHAAAAMQYPEVNAAVASKRWTGSAYTVVVTVQRKGGVPFDPTFQAAVSALLEPLRLAGWDVEVVPPSFVPIEVTLGIEVASGYLPSEVLTAVQSKLGTAGFFDPDNFSFGQQIYFSQIVAAAMAVPGVAWVETDPSKTVFCVARGPQPPFDPSASPIQLGATELPVLQGGAVTLNLLQAASS